MIIATLSTPLTARSGQTLGEGLATLQDGSSVTVYNAMSALVAEGTNCILGLIDGKQFVIAADCP